MSFENKVFRAAKLSVLIFMMGCGQFGTVPGNKSAVGSTSTATTSSAPQTGSTPPPFGQPGGGAGIGSTVAGTGAASVPTGQAILGRITNALPGVSPLTGNFQKAIAAYASELPTSSDPTKAHGYDIAALVAYAACSDYTTVPKGGGTSMMQSKLGVTNASTPTQNIAALKAAGQKIMDNTLGGLATNGPNASQIQSIFSTTASSCAATSANTSTMCFISVCTPAVTVSVVGMGF